MDPISLAMALGTSGSGSPISLTGSPVDSAANPNTSFSVNYGAFQVGGKGNEATSTLPTPNSIFDPATGIGDGSNLVMLATAGLILLAIFKMVR